jgi:hypothetical protein
MQFNFSSTLEKAEKDYGLGSGSSFKVKEGDNYIRILSGLEPHPGEYQGKPTFKFVGWVLDRRDKQVKLYFMPVTIFKAIEALQKNPEYTFTEVPMPYDINVNAKQAGTTDVVYTVMGARQNTPLTADEQKAFADKPAIVEVLAKLREANATTATAKAPGTFTDGSPVPIE